MVTTLRNPRHERFAQELAGGKTAIEAYRLAGYRPDRPNASRLQYEHNILHRVDEILAERERIHAQATVLAIERATVNKEWVLDRLRQNVERAMQIEQVKRASGIPTGEFRYQGSVANRALELLGKELGMFYDRAENRLSLEARVAAMTPQERLALADELLERAQKYVPLFEQYQREHPAQNYQTGRGSSAATSVRCTLLLMATAGTARAILRTRKTRDLRELEPQVGNARHHD